MQSTKEHSKMIERKPRQTTDRTSTKPKSHRLGTIPIRLTAAIILLSNINYVCAVNNDDVFGRLESNTWKSGFLLNLEVEVPNHWTVANIPGGAYAEVKDGEKTRLYQNTSMQLTLENLSYARVFRAESNRVPGQFASLEIEYHRIPEVQNFPTFVLFHAERLKESERSDQRRLTEPTTYDSVVWIDGYRCFQVDLECIHSEGSRHARYLFVPSGDHCIVIEWLFQDGAVRCRLDELMYEMVRIHPHAEPATKLDAVLQFRAQMRKAKPVLGGKLRELQVTLDGALENRGILLEDAAWYLGSRVPHHRVPVGFGTHTGGGFLGLATGIGNAAAARMAIKNADSYLSEIQRTTDDREALRLASIREVLSESEMQTLVEFYPILYQHLTDEKDWSKFESDVSGIWADFPSPPVAVSLDAGLGYLADFNRERYHMTVMAIPAEIMAMLKSKGLQKSLSEAFVKEQDFTIETSDFAEPNISFDMTFVTSTDARGKQRMVDRIVCLSEHIVHMSASFPSDVDKSSDANRFLNSLHFPK